MDALISQAQREITNNVTCLLISHRYIFLDLNNKERDNLVPSCQLIILQQRKDEDTKGFVYSTMLIIDKEILRFIAVRYVSLFSKWCARTPLVL